MPELQERWQPALLDRLLDDEPDRKQESRDKRVMSMRQIRASVLRDLTWLLNTGNLQCVPELQQHPRAAASVINYGLPDLTGLTASGLEIHQLEKVIRDAIVTYEPRLLPGSLRVRVLADGARGPNSLAFEITGELWSEPLPEALFLKTEVDLETGDFALEEHVEQGAR